MRTEVLAEEHWQDAYLRRVGKLQGDPRQAKAFLRLAQGQGIGLPIEAAFDFDDWLKGHSGGKQLWHDIFVSLFVKVDLHELGVSQGAIQNALRQAPFDAATLVLLPVAKRVLSVGDRNVLLSVHSGTDDTIGNSYERYVSDFDASLLALAKDKSKDTAAWRKALGLGLVTFCLGADAIDTDAALPHDALGSAHFLAAPRTTLTLQEVHKPDMRLTFGGARQDIKFNYDGITGIRHASPSEDPSGMVPTQLVYPFPFLVERIMNEGFMAFARPPPLPQDVDILFLCIADDLPDSVPVSLLRAAWWLACRRAELVFSDTNAQFASCWMAQRSGRLARDTVLRLSDGQNHAVAAQSREAYIALFADLHAPFVAASTLKHRGVAAPPHGAPSLLEQLDTLGVRVSPERRARLKLCVIDASSAVNAQDAAKEGSGIAEQLRAIAPDRMTRGTVLLGRDAPDGPEKITLDGGVEWYVPDGFRDQMDIVDALRQAFLEKMTAVRADG